MAGDLIKRSVLLIPVLGAILVAQPAGVPKFEVVSVKPCRPDAPRGRSNNAPPNGPTELLRINCQTVERLIEIAYDFLATGKPRFRGNPIPIEGAPGWIHSERFTIEAKSETPQSVGMMDGPMMQQILEDRFKLKLRRDPRQVPVYFLTVAKGGPKNLAPAKPGSCLAWDLDHMAAFRPGAGVEPCGIIGRRIDAGTAVVEIFGATMATFAEQLQILVDRDVIDKTGISGTFDIHVEMPVEDLTTDAAGRPDDAAPRPPADESAMAFAAVRKLGLKLESGTGPGEIFVVDHIERPSEN